MKPVLTALFAVMLIAGCSATPATQATYYRLPDRTQAGRIQVEQTAPVLVIERLQLAGFLLQSGLVMQQGESLLQVSRQHLWAESLDVALHKALQSALQIATTDVHVYLQGPDFVATTDYTLRLQIDNFQATDAGLVLLSGRYQLVDTKAGTELVRRNFSFNRPLDEDGYPHVVSLLQSLLESLASRISEDLATTMQTGNSAP